MTHSFTDEQIDRAAEASAEKANGGRFVDPLFYAPEHRQFWREVVKAAIEAAEISEWQPIATAPQDGTEFDGWGYCIPDNGEMPTDPELKRHTECYWGSRDSYYVQKRFGKDGWCSEGHDGWSWAMVLTHWRPVPVGPEISETQFSAGKMGVKNP